MSQILDNFTPTGKPFAGSSDPARYIHEVTTTPHKQRLIDTQTGEVLPFAGSSDGTNERADSLIRRYSLQDQAAKILLDFHPEPTKNKNGFVELHRTCKCMRTSISKPQVQKSREFNAAFYAGLVQCGSYWTCSVCAAKIAERRATEIRQAFAAAKKAKLFVSLMTFTVPHHAGDTITRLMPAISTALASFWRGKASDMFKRNHGIKGNIRSLELLHGKNGWHPHFHLIIFSETPFRFDSVRLLKRWQGVCVRAGLDRPNEYGLDIRDGSKAGEYVNKFADNAVVQKTKDGKEITWDMGDEVTKGHVKKGGSGSLTPWQMLDASVSSSMYRGLFLEYARVMKGKSCLKWSRGLRDYFGVEKEVSDEEIVSKNDTNSHLMAIFLTDEWKEIRKTRNRGILIQIASNGSWQDVARFVYELTTPDTTFIEYLLDFGVRTLSSGEGIDLDARDLDSVRYG